MDKIKENQKISKDRKKYLRKIKQEKMMILLSQILIVVGFITLWEILANKGIIDSFIMSSPSRMLKTFLNLSQNDLLRHVQVTCYETIVGFVLGTTMGSIIAVFLWWSKRLSKIAEPFLVVLNSLPKVALRTNYYHLGRSGSSSNYCNGTSYFISCYYFGNLKWISKYRQRTNKNGKNL